MQRRFAGHTAENDAEPCAVAILQISGDVGNGHSSFGQKTFCLLHAQFGQKPVRRRKPRLFPFAQKRTIGKTVPQSKFFPVWRFPEVELKPIARYSGLEEIPRGSIFHALNQKAVAKRYAKEAGKPYESLRLVVVHMGGGVSVGAHENGKVVDVFSAFDGDGAFSPERAGGVPCAALVKMCFSGKYTEKEISAKLIGKGGLNSYLGTNDMREVTKRANEGDAKAAEVKQAFLLQVAKDIGAMACVLNGKVDQIVITGGIAYGEDVVAKLKERCGWIAPVTVYPGEDELLALAQGALRVMNGEEQVKQY